MFTGIVEAVGRVAALDGGRLLVDAPGLPEGTAVGDSVSVSGVCLTVTDLEGGRLAFDLADETLRRTTLGALAPGAPVNLERAATLATRLGGHLVQGHVDGVGRVREVAAADTGREVVVEVPDGLSRYAVEKGSVTVDGVSLTVAALEDGGFRVALIPHTLEATTLGERAEGDAVNLEMDVLAKYVERLMQS
jgi:riboflavin synthase